MPTVIILKRKGIRVFSDNQKIGLYYSQYLDRYISIPFGPGVPSINEAVDYQKAYQDYLKDYGDDEDKKKTRSPEDVKKLVMQKAGEGKIRAKHYSVFSKNDGAERKELKKASNQYLKDKFFSGQITALDALAAKAGVATGAAVRRAVTEPIRDKIRQIRGKTKTTEPTVTEPQAAPKTILVPKVLTKKQQDVKADVSARMASAKKSALKAKDPSVAKASRQMAANRARKVATYAQIDKRKAGLMEKIVEVKARNNQLNELAPLAALAVPAAIAGARVAGPMLAKVLARAPKKAPTPAAPKPIEVPPVKIPPAKPIETPVAPKPAEIPALPKPVETPVVPQPFRPATPSAPVPPAVPEVPVSPKVEPPATKLEVPPPATLAVPRTGGATKTDKGGSPPKRPGQGRRSLARRLSLDAEPEPKNSDDTKEPPKYFDPAKFGLKITTSKPEAQVTTGVEKRQANLYRKALEVPVNEENQEDESSVKTTPRFLTPTKSSSKVSVSAPKAQVRTGVEKRQSNLYRKSLEAPVAEQKEEEKAKLKPTSFSLKVKTSAPKSKVKTGVEARMQKYERDYYTQQNESVLKSIKKMVSEGTTEMQLNICENSITINNTIAQKIVSVHESLNKDNKKQFENMLGESVESFKKIVNFAVRQ
jgi:hypothetical protein